MSFYTGSGTTLAINEPRQGWGDSVGTGFQVVNYTSESLNENVTKADEGSLLASKTATTRDLMSIDVGGSVSFILRPEFADKLFEAALGKKNGDVYTLAGTNEDLPVFDIYVDRKAKKYLYSSAMISSMSLDCNAGDYVKGSFDVKAYQGSGVGTQAVETIPLSNPSYRCTSAKLSYGADELDITGFSININNSLEDAPKTYSSGLYAGKPQHGQRAVDGTIRMPYGSFPEDKFDLMYASGYLGQSSNMHISLEFSNGAGKKVNIEIPNLAITAISNSIGGAGYIEQTLEGTALSVGDAEPITVTLTSN